MRKSTVYYAVKVGRRPGIYSGSYDEEVRPLVEKFKGAEHKKFNTRSEAELYMGVPSNVDSKEVPSGGSAVKCKCNRSQPLQLLTTKKEGQNKGRKFYKCFSCNFFEWADGEPSQAAGVSASGSDASPTTNVREGDLIIYTDGSCIGNNKVAENNCPAGWSAVILRISKDDDSSFASGSNEPKNSVMKLVDELYGPVWKDPTSPYYLGATVGSNNTGELSAIGEAFMYVRDVYLPSRNKAEAVLSVSQSPTDCTSHGSASINPLASSHSVSNPLTSSSSSSGNGSSLSLKTILSAAQARAKGLPIAPRSGIESTITRPLISGTASSGSSVTNVIIRYDSEYAANSAIGKFNGPKNRELVVTVNKIYNQLCAVPALRVMMQKVKAHSGEEWNDRADLLANVGARGEVCNSGRYGPSATGASASATGASATYSNHSTNQRHTLKPSTTGIAAAVNPPPPLPGKSTETEAKPKASLLPSSSSYVSAKKPAPLNSSKEENHNIAATAAVASVASKPRSSSVVVTAPASVHVLDLTLDNDADADNHVDVDGAYYVAAGVTTSASRAPLSNSDIRASGTMTIDLSIDEDEDDHEQKRQQHINGNSSYQHGGEDDNDEDNLRKRRRTP